MQARISELEGSLSAEKAERTNSHKALCGAKAALKKAKEGHDTAEEMLRDMELQLCKLQGQMRDSKDSAKVCQALGARLMIFYLHEAEAAVLWAYLRGNNLLQFPSPAM